MNTKDTLEQLMDEMTLTELLHEVGIICIEKSEHIQESYNDTPLAKAWKKQGEKIISLACKFQKA